MTKAQEKVVLGWHWIRADGKLNYDLKQETMIVGETRSLPAKQAPLVCHRGFHACYTAMGALAYSQGPILCRVQLWGDIDTDWFFSDKIAARHRRVLWAIDATRTIHQLSINIAKILLYKNELHLVRNKQAWLDGKNPSYQSPYHSGATYSLLSTQTSSAASAIINKGVTEEQFQAQLKKDLQLPTVSS